ncbi:MAG: hypothetical protein HY696_05540 [Deltaproteobacteria bacterium]|nr:hypothetical protein [Deltaproteobacteria bacterium]
MCQSDARVGRVGEPIDMTTARVATSHFAHTPPATPSADRLFESPDGGTGR